ncbi:cupin domain-containing protein [Zobellella maritima]|uniref:cupin domain-containing protein n=1 Tax=Zobellella maritima TaxID=2059725 RepID=UPI000E30AF63|nr:AraC family ligand binding domain-containing protein [Zobellella maritima]
MTSRQHYSISYLFHASTKLTPGKRRRHPKGQLLLVHQGSGLLQLGRHHYPLVAGQAVYLAADTLFAWHAFAGARVSTLLLSPRLTQPLDSGRLPASALLPALLDKLAHWQQPKDWQGPYGRLCRAAYDELLALSFSPVESQPPLLTRITQAPTEFRLDSQEQPDFRRQFDTDADSWRLQAKLLFALRDLGQGLGLEQLAERYGFAGVPQFEQDCRQWLGTPCHQRGKTG